MASDPLAIWDQHIASMRNEARVEAYRMENSVEWYTPPYIFDALALTFDLDPSSPGDGPVHVPARRFAIPPNDGLAMVWDGLIWMNPPYGRKGLDAWVERLAIHGNGVGLVFARTDTRWFHDYATRADVLCFIRSRVKFLRPDGSSGGRTWEQSGPPAPSMLIAFGEVAAAAVAACGLGWIVDQRGQDRRPAVEQGNLLAGADGRQVG